MKLYYNKDRDKTVALLEEAGASASGKLKERGYKYICTVFQLGKDVTDLGLGVSKEARQWYKEELFAFEPNVRLLELRVKRLERLAEENGWNNYSSKSVK